MNMIGNSRYVVVGELPDGRRAPIAASDSRIAAGQTLDAGRMIDGTYWRGHRVHDRRTEGLTPSGGWSELS